MRTDRRGFSSVLAILLTAFLVVLSSGVLFLFVAESRISRSLFDGFSAYAGAEASMEYALLKIKNHREGFEDALRRNSPEGRVFSSANRRGAEIGYSISAFSTAHSGTLAPGEMEIVPLFFDKGTVLRANSTGLPFKDPRADSSNVERTSDFVVSAASDFSWNLIGSDSEGNTFGIVGTGGISGVGNGVSATVSSGFMRSVSPEGETEDRDVPIGDFLSRYDDVYLAITNPASVPLEYRIVSSNGFSKPSISVSAVGKAGSSVTNLEFKENRSRHFDALRYSLFDAGG